MWSRWCAVFYDEIRGAWAQSWAILQSRTLFYLLTREIVGLMDSNKRGGCADVW